MSETVDRRAGTRQRIVEAAAQVLREQGPAAVTTRGVADAAGVQAPTLYRLFGDKEGLLDAVAEHVMAGYVSDKAATVDAASADGVDPLDDLRAGWDTQIEFGLANPAIFRMLSDPDRVRHSPAAVSGRQVLAARVRRVAVAGRLRVSEERAVDLIAAAGVGAISVLLSTPEPERDRGLADAMYEAVLAQVLDGTPDGVPERAEAGPMAATVAFRAIAPELHVLSGSERRLLSDWLDRVVADLGAGARVTSD
ncbi:TetR/AcrR family transcriptional regulator [Nocardioides mangrovicus]|uniref:TetR/AcrR family transcriptional regulator n=1 Tax=Nocardioides mangrovicus TaxID=2478913 RepID=A0A3L8P588_9ACTN|nr:TetR/AcrR family transcriptional regulator [Nocardioides mangrovicus]RLV50530.1 TetR/AcrR family transcriptional regulator [Nocardioides mangrovicus]